MITQIAQALLLRVYDSVTAVISMDEKNSVLGVKLFDTYFGMQDPVKMPGSGSVHVICNHPEGRMTLVLEEIRNCRQIFAQRGTAQVHVYIFGEDIGLIEVDRSEILDYNGENAS